MSESLIVSDRGQITLPAVMRKHLGITRGSSLIIEEVDGELRLRPATVLPVDTYTDEEIFEWNKADKLSPEERRQILTRLQEGAA